MKSQIEVIDIPMSDEEKTNEENSDLEKNVNNGKGAI